MNGFQKRTELKKRNILEAAQELFEDSGFKHVTIHEIARRAGVSPITIYNHYGSKEILVREIVKSVFSDIIEKFRVILKEKDKFPQKLESVLYLTTTLASRFQGELFGPVLLGDAEIRRLEESVWKKERQVLIVELFKQGKEQGYISRKISQKSIEVFMEIFRRGIISDRALLSAIEHNQKLFHDLGFLFLYGLDG
jgi:AcrR family transcriptional regulator